MIFLGGAFPVGHLCRLKRSFAICVYKIAGLTPDAWSAKNKRSAIAVQRKTTAPTHLLASVGKSGLGFKEGLQVQKIPSSFRKLMQNAELGSTGIWEAILMVIFRKRWARKLHRIILLHFGLVTFRSHFGKARKCFIFLVFGPSECYHDAQHQLLLTLGPPTYGKKYKKPQILGGNNNVESSSSWTSKNWTRYGPRNPEDPFNIC